MCQRARDVAELVCELVPASARHVHGHGLDAEHTGQPLAKVASDLERDYYMSSEEAFAYGVIDRVISHR